MTKVSSVTTLFLLSLPFACASKPTPSDVNQYFVEFAATYQARRGDMPECRVGFRPSETLRVASTSVAARMAGLRNGDIIRSVDGQQVSNLDQLTAVLKEKLAGDGVQLGVEREARDLNIEAICQDGREVDRQIVAAAEAGASGRWQECISLVNSAEAITGPSYYLAIMRLNCSEQRRLAAKRAPTFQDAHLAYEARRIGINEATNSRSSEHLNAVRGDVLLAISWLERAGFASFASDLTAQLASAEAQLQDRPPFEDPGGVATGTCFAVSADGLVATAHHVVAGAKRLRVAFVGGDFMDATIVTATAATDLAILRVSGVRQEVYLPLGAPGDLGVGDRVFTIGFPVTSILGEEPKYTDGVVSSLSGVQGEATLLQITVPVQPGNSGGPLLNEAGEVVGIISSVAAVGAFLRESGTLPQNVNWAVKAEYLRLLLPNASLPSAPEAEAIERARRAVCRIQSES